MHGRATSKRPAPDRQATHGTAWAPMTKNRFGVPWSMPTGGNRLRQVAGRRERLRPPDPRWGVRMPQMAQSSPTGASGGRTGPKSLKTVQTPAVASATQPRARTVAECHARDRDTPDFRSCAAGFEPFSGPKKGPTNAGIHHRTVPKHSTVPTAYKVLAVTVGRRMACILSATVIQGVIADMA